MIDLNSETIRQYLWAQAPNFTLDELVASKVAAQNKLRNTPEAVHQLNLLLLAVTVLQPLRNHFKRPVRVTSGYRSQELLAKLAELAIKYPKKYGMPSKTSLHCRGLAVDIQIKGVSKKRIAEFVRDNLTFEECIIEPNWVHIGILPGINKGELMHSPDGRRYLPGLGE